MKRLYRKLLRRRRKGDGSDGAELPPSEVAPEAGEPPKAPKPAKAPAGPAKGPAPKGPAGSPKGPAGPPKGPAPKGPSGPAKFPGPVKAPPSPEWVPKAYTGDENLPQWFYKGPSASKGQKKSEVLQPGKVQKPSGPKKKVTKPPKPVKAPEPTKNPKAGKASKPAAPQKETIASDGNDSNEEDPPLSPEDASPTGLTSGMSVTDTKDKPDDDIDMPDADPIQLESVPSPPAGEGEIQGSSSSSEWFDGAKRTHVEDSESVSQESGSSKRPRIETTESTQDLTAGKISTLNQGVPNPGSREAPSGPKSPRVDTTLDSNPSESDDELNYHTPLEETVDKWRKKGAQLQAWLEDPNEPNCNIAPATAILEDLMGKDIPKVRRFQQKIKIIQGPENLLDGGESESLGLPTKGRRYRYVEVENRVRDKKTLRKYSRRYLTNRFVHVIGPGIIAGMNIKRYDNVQWNVLARALYDDYHPISTLKYIMFDHVVNDETAPYITLVLYPRLGRVFANEADGEKLVKLERDTPEFHELLGTKLGKAAAILLLSSFPRGTRRITRAVIWNRDRALQVRFEVEATGEGQEIERIPTPPPTPELVPNPEPRPDSDDEGETEHVELAD